MRLSLGLKPASEEAKQQGCICKGEKHIDVHCPVHFPLKYLFKLEDFSKQVKYMQLESRVFKLLLIGMFTAIIMLLLH